MFALLGSNLALSNLNFLFLFCYFPISSFGIGMLTQGHCIPEICRRLFHMTGFQIPWISKDTDDGHVNSVEPLQAKEAFEVVVNALCIVRWPHAFQFRVGGGLGLNRKSFPLHARFLSVYSSVGGAVLTAKENIRGRYGWWHGTSTWPLKVIPTLGSLLLLFVLWPDANSCFCYYGWNVEYSVRPVPLQGTEMMSQNKYFLTLSVFDHIT